MIGKGKPQTGLTRSKLEEMVRAAGMAPEIKMEVPEGKVYVADGFAAQPGLTHWRLYRGQPALFDKEFPMGAYCTMWWLADNEDNVRGGTPLFFDALHDVEKGWDAETKKRARLNTAVAEAKGFLKAWDRVNG